MTESPRHAIIGSLILIWWAATLCLIVSHYGDDRFKHHPKEIPASRQK